MHASRRSLALLVLLAAALLLACGCSPQLAMQPRTVAPCSWSYFGDPRSVAHESHVFTGRVGTDGRTVIEDFDLDTGRRRLRTLFEPLEADDHNNPSLVFFRERLYAFSAPHSGYLYPRDRRSRGRRGRRSGRDGSGDRGAHRRNECDLRVARRDRVAGMEHTARPQALAVDVGPVARELVVGHDPVGPDPLELGVQARDLAVPAERHVVTRATADRQMPASLGELDDDLAVLAVTVEQERDPAALGREPFAQLERRGDVACERMWTRPPA